METTLWISKPVEDVEDVQARASEHFRASLWLISDQPIHAALKIAECDFLLNILHLCF